MKHIYFFLAAMFITVQVFAQTTRYVDASADGNGTSWADAYISLQSALDAASSGDEIWVAKGTYNPSSANGLTNTSRFYHFRMINGVAIYGGFAGTETATTQRTSYGVGETNETILSGDIGVIDDNSDNCYHVFYHPSSIDATAILDGFTITGGNANGSSPHNNGGGMYNSSSSPTIRNCILISNAATGDGGGLYNSSGSPTFTNGLIIQNTARRGGGFLSNNSTSIFNNVTFSKNTATYLGGGVMIINPATTNYNNCIFWGNTASNNGNQIRINLGTVILNYSCYSNSTNDIDVGTGTFTATNFNITSDPQFVDSDNGDYRIIGNSPAADAGNDSYNSQTYDIRGNGFDRKLDKTDGSAGTIDMGAYEYKFSNNPLPVELISFTAAIKNGTVELNWQTATEVNNYGFEIERTVVSGQRSVVSWTLNAESWTKIGFVAGHGNSNSPNQYSFTDNLLDLNLGLNFSYRLKQIDFDGKFSYSDVVEVELQNIPTEYALYQNYPNPFNPTTIIRYHLPAQNQVTIKVYNMLGSEIATLVDEIKEAGVHEIEFTNNGQYSSGIYFYTMQTVNFIDTKKFVMVK